MYASKQVQVIPELYQTNNLIIIKTRLSNISKNPERYSRGELISTIRFLEELVNEI